MRQVAGAPRRTPPAALRANRPRPNRPPRARRPPGTPPRAPNLAPSVHPPASGQQNALFLASDDGFATSFPPSRAPEPGRRNRDLGFSRGAPAQTAAFAAPAGRKRLQTRHRLPENRPDPARNPADYDLHDSPPARPEKKSHPGWGVRGGFQYARRRRGNVRMHEVRREIEREEGSRRRRGSDPLGLSTSARSLRGLRGPSLLADASIEREERPRTGRRAFFTFAYGFRCWRETWREHRRRSPCSRAHLRCQAPAPRGGPPAPRVKDRRTPWSAAGRRAAGQPCGHQPPPTPPRGRCR